MKKVNRRSDMLLLVTSAKSKGLEFPREGQSWNAFEREGVSLGYKNSRLISPVFAVGARAENFCGIYEQPDVFARIFSDPKKQGLEFTLNPFK